MSGLVVSGEVTARDEFGRFLAKLNGAAERTASQTLDVGMRASRDAAPERTGHLKASFQKVMFGKSGVYLNSAAYAKFQDQGAAPNEKPADVSFFWENQGKFWNPDKTGTQVIHHPGNPAVHFMIAGKVPMRAAAPGIMRRNYA